MANDIFPVLHPSRLPHDASLSVCLMACVRGNVYEPMKFSLPKSSSYTSITISLFSGEEGTLRSAEKFHSGSRLFLTFLDLNSCSLNLIFINGSDFPIISLFSSSDPLNTIIFKIPGFIIGGSSSDSFSSESCSVASNSLSTPDCLPSDKYISFMKESGAVSITFSLSCASSNSFSGADCLPSVV